ncbi:MAG: response regulator receiver protein [Bryobacterales bacterium]|nr:response regulator receiver protein [Bryobacterales bacterium]
MAVPKRILIVDDDPDVHGSLRAALDAPDRKIESAYDGHTGLRLIRNAAYDLVLTDLNMLELNGMTLLERIREVRPATRVVVMTAANTPENVVRAIRERAFSYFSKPFTVNAVIEMVDRALSGSDAEDDIQVLSARPNWLGLRLRCKVETAGRIVQFIRELGMDLPAVEQDQVTTAFREILLNAIEHGAGGDPDKRVFITYVRTKRAALYYVRDPGKGFSFDRLAHAAVSNPEDSPVEHAEVRERLGMRPGGFGILMTRELVDELIYSEHGNEVLLIKYLDVNRS